MINVTKEKKLKVKVYSTPMCLYCVMEKDWLKENNIEFEDINVAENKRAAKEMIEKSGQISVPVTDVSGTIIIGFDKEKLRRALGL